MTQVSVTINGRNYRIACDDGQEEHLTKLASYVDERVSDLVKAVGQIGDTRLLVMASLLIADELSDSYAEADKLKQAAADGDAAAALAADIDTLADQVEAIAARLEGS